MGKQNTNPYPRKKGQMFFIAAIFMIIGFVLLRGVLSLPAISQEKAFQETAFSDRNLKNIRGEYENIAGIASLQPNSSSSGAGYLYNFSKYIRSEFDSRILYVFIVSNGSTQSFYATIGNFMQGNITGNLSFAGAFSTSSAFSLSDRSNATYYFTGANAWVGVTLNYTHQGTQTVERFYFNDSSRNYVAAFFDITLREQGMMVRSKSYYNRTW